MSLLEDWRNEAYGVDINSPQGKKFWEHYFQLEKGIYEKILADADNVVEGTVEELANKFDVELKIMVGVLDGIDDSLIHSNPIETMDKDTKVNMGFDKELLYKNMVGADAPWLYNLPVWDELIDEKRRKELYLEQKKSGTVVKDKKVGRNDPCPCGSGKKYKQCCMRKAQ